MVEFLLIDKTNFDKSIEIQVHEENIGGCKLYKDGESPQPCDFDTVDSSEVNVKRSVLTTFMSIFTLFHLLRKEKILLSLLSMLHRQNALSLLTLISKFDDVGNDDEYN